MANPKSTAERRLYKRFETDSPVEILAEGGATYHARCLNVSLAGMQVSCDRDTVYGIAPKVEKTTPDQSPVARIRFDLPNGNTQVEADCRIVLVRRVSEREYHVHVQYEFFQGNGYNELEDFVDAMLEHTPL